MAINWTLFPWFTLPMSENMVPYSEKHWFWVDVAEQWTSNGVHVCFDGLCRHSTLFRGTSDSINSIKRYWNSTWTTMRVSNRYVSFSNNECDIKPLTTEQNPGTREHHKSTRAVLSMALWCLRMMPFSAASTKAGMRNTSAAWVRNRRNLHDLCFQVCAKSDLLVCQPDGATPNPGVHCGIGHRLSLGWPS
jgi:hypothetical protein